MIKLIDSSDYNWPESPVQLIKLSSRGLRGFDRDQFLKRAGHSVLSQFDNLVFGPGEQPVHQYALGTTEAVGPNRNYDGFPKRACERFHGTFVKHARCYREHANRDKTKSYGHVKASEFNDIMQRIELINALNATKEAAERNGGLIADEELESLAKYGTYGVSMACMVPFDFCSFCNNAARNRSEYCKSAGEGGHCEAGGLSRNIGRVLSDGHVLHAINEEPRFFDISKVKKPADHIAYVTGQLKSATVSSRNEYDMLPPLSLLADGIVGRLRLDKHLELVHKLACMEQDLQPSAARLLQVGGSLQTIPMPKEAQEYPRQALRALAEIGGVLSLAGFAQLFGNQSEKEAAQTAAYIGDDVSRCFSTLLVDGDLQAQFSNNSFSASRDTTPTLRKWASEICDEVSLLSDVARLRAMRNAINSRVPQPLSSPRIKSASTCNIIAQYALYKSGAVLDIFSQKGEDLLTPDLVIIQNLTK